MGDRVIDNFSLFLTHGLLLLAAWRLVLRPDLDSEPPASPAPAEETAAKGFGTPLRHSPKSGDDEGRRDA